MNRIKHIFIALSAVLALAACTQEPLAGPGGGAIGDGTFVDATFSVELGPQTKAFADGTTVDKLYAGIYEIGGTQQAPTYTWVADNADAPAAFSEKAANVTFKGKVEMGKSYKVVFWAQKQGNLYSIDWAKTATTGPTVTATATGEANAEARDAFFGTYDTGAITGSINLTNSPISLKRPFAQVNILVPNGNIADASAAVTSSMTVAQAPTVLNLATKATSDPADWTFSAAAIDEAAFGNYASTHKYVAMNYVLVDQTAADARYNVTFSVTSGSQSVTDKALTNIPLKPNGRTNVVGNIFDSNFDLTVPVIVDPGTGTEQELTTVTVTVGQNAASAVALDAGYNADPSQRTAIPIEVAVSHPIEVEADKPQITVEPATVATAEWNLTTGKLDVTPLVANGNAVITLVFPAVTKTEYSAATVQLFVRVGNGINEEQPEQVATPTFTPAAGEYTAAQNVEIACATDGASIYYTTDGTDPTAASTAYTSAIAVGATTTIKAIAVKEGWTDSEIATAAYTINIPEEPDFTTVSELKGLLSTESATYTGTLSDAVVSFIASTSDAVIKDATGSILYHKETGHGLLQGQTISGDVIVEAVIYNGINEITDLAATVEGEGCAVEPELVTLNELSQDYAKYESAYVKVVGVTSLTTTTTKGNITGRQDATDYIIYTNVPIPVNAGDVFTAEGTITRYNVTEELKVWKTSDLTVTTPAPVLSATPAATTVAATATSVTWNISSNTDWTITPGAGVTPSTTSGNGNAEVTLSFAANESTDAVTYTATATADGCPDVTITITQNGTGSSSTITDELTSALFTATSTTYADFSNVAATSSARYAGNSAKDSSGNIQLRSKNSNSGIVSTTSGGKVKSVTITVANGSNTIDVYGSNTAYTGAGDLYATGEGGNQGTKIGSLTETGTIDFTKKAEQYAYVGIRSNNGALYISKIEIEWE